MKVLEARFHPHSKAREGAVVIGRVISDHDRVSLELANVSEKEVQPFGLQALVHKLRFLVDPTTPGAFDLLKRFQSDFWTFEEVSVQTRRPGPG